MILESGMMNEIRRMMNETRSLEVTAKKHHGHIDYNHFSTTQRKSGMKQPCPLRDASNEFREDLKNFKLEKRSCWY
jgi:hypothetical protein